MQDEVLTNILNLLQSDSGTKSNNANPNPNNNNNANNNGNLQGMLIKMLLSGQLNNLFAPKPQEAEPTPPPPPPRTINLENYKRLD